MTEHVSYREGYRIKAHQVVAPLGREPGRWSALVLDGRSVVRAVGGETLEEVLAEVNAWIDRHPGPQPEMFEPET